MIPTYRQAALLRRALDSALEQTYVPLEIVVADDASPDGTAEVVAGYGGDARLVYRRNERNLGRVGNYRNTLEHHVRGAWVLNLDGDDWLLEPDYLARAMALVAVHPDLALVFARARDVSAGGGASDEGTVNRGLPEVCDGTALFLAYADGTVHVPHMTALYRRDLALALDFYTHPVIGADSVALLSLLPGRRVGFVDVVAGVWHKHAANATWSRGLQARLDNFAVVDVPAQRAASILAPPVLDRWRRRMGVRLGESYAADCLATGRVAGAVAFVGALACRRPRVAAGVMAGLLRRVVRRVGEAVS
jgi:glycosyltransferase involved in cell wall biosynthesis